MAKTIFFTAKNITKKPNLLKHFGKKNILLLTGKGSFPFNKREEAIRFIKQTPEFQRRVNKPKIKLRIVRS